MNNVTIACSFFCMPLCLFEDVYCRCSVIKFVHVVSVGFSSLHTVVAGCVESCVSILKAL